MDDEFEFDAAKSVANRDKHGIDFVEAQLLWAVPAFDRPSPFVSESRRLRTGKIENRFWTAVYTLRNASIRLISVRRARAEEVVDHERHIKDRAGADLEP